MKKTFFNINLKNTTFLLVFFFGLMIIINFLANYIPINKQTTAQISNKFPTLFTPAGITFSIWGIIYFMILMFLIFEIRRTFFQKNFDASRKKYQFAFMLSCLLNSLWIICWHFNLILLAFVIMIMLLLSLIYIYKTVFLLEYSSLIEKFFTKTSFSLYLAWICVASVANFTILLKSYGIDSIIFSESFFTIILLLMLTILSIIVLFKRNDITFTIVSIWAISGIVINRLSDEIIHLNIIFSSLAIVLVLVFLILIKILIPNTLSNE